MVPIWYPIWPSWQPSWKSYYLYSKKNRKSFSLRFPPEDFLSCLLGTKWKNGADVTNIMSTTTANLKILLLLKKIRDGFNTQQLKLLWNVLMNSWKFFLANRMSVSEELLFFILKTTPNMAIFLCRKIQSVWFCYFFPLE
jgi:hypothetical protein